MGYVRIVTNTEKTEIKFSEISINRMISKTFQEIGKSGIKELCKTRSFNRDLKSDQLEVLFATDQGVAQAFAFLSGAEKDFLCHLAVQSKNNKFLEVRDFASLYPDKVKKGYGYTYAAKYKDLFKTVKERFLRKGVLVLEENLSFGRESKLERTILGVLPAFRPVILENMNFHRNSTAVESSTNFFRDELKKILTGKEKEKGKGKGKGTKSNPVLMLKNGKINFASGNNLAPSTLNSRQRKVWSKNIDIDYDPKKKKSGKNEKEMTMIVDAVLNLLDLLGPGQWLSAPDIRRIAGYALESLGKMHDANFKKICTEGWKAGLLWKIEEGPSVFYRPAPDQFHRDGVEGNVSPECLQFTSPEKITVNPETVFPEETRKIGLFGNFVIKNGSLCIQPSFIDMARNFDKVGACPLLKVLCERSPSFDETFKKVKKKFGKIVIHDNISIFRIKDLSLLVNIEKKLSGKCVKLSDQFLAVPRNLVPDVNKVVVKAGYATRTFERD